MSDEDGNFISEKLKRILQKQNEHRTISIIIIPSQSNGQVETCYQILKVNAQKVHRYQC